MGKSCRMLRFMGLAFLNLNPRLAFHGKHRSQYIRFRSTAGFKPALVIMVCAL